MQQNKVQPQQRAQQIVSLLEQAQQSCRADLEGLDDARAQAMFETIAEVLGGAMKALNDYQGRSELAWRSSTHDVHTVQPQTPAISDLRVDVDASEPPPPLTQLMREGS